MACGAWTGNTPAWGSVRVEVPGKRGRTVKEYREDQSGQALGGQLSRRAVLGRAAGAGVALAGAAYLSRSSVSAQEGTPVPQATPTAGGTPTVVLVHGAFADGSSWSGVIDLLQAAGIETIAVANPLRGIAHDAAYLAGVLGTISGPTLLVGHSYGGAVISGVPAGAGNVLGLVYVAAFAPDEGETALDVLGRFPPTVLGTALRPATTDTGNQELLIDPAVFHEIFAADLPKNVAARLATVQRPVASATFAERAGPPAWKRLPSCAAVATDDKALGAAVPFYAERGRLRPRSRLRTRSWFLLPRH
jgi:pimeloyl-ACP methyl ester carboxylesterase